MKKSNTVIAVIISVFLTIVLVSLVNVGYALFYEGPEYSDFCGDQRVIPKPVGEEGDAYTACPSVCTKLYEIQAVQCVTEPCPAQCVLNECGSGCGADGINSFETLDACEAVIESGSCYEAYEDSRDDYNQSRFFVLAGIGFLLLLLGLFIPNTMIKIIGLTGGAVLVIEAILLNLQNKPAVFISLTLILIIFGYFGIRTVMKDG